jgi:hypothetical protein
MVIDDVGPADTQKDDDDEASELVNETTPTPVADGDLNRDINLRFKVEEQTFFVFFQLQCRVLQRPV